MPRHHRKKIIDVISAIVLLALIMLDAALWKNIFVAGKVDATRIYFLPVAQGESALLVLPNGVTALTDAGSDDSIIDDLQKALPSGVPPYIDLAIISYPQIADYEGYQYILQHYRVGAFIYNGRIDVAHVTEWNQLVAAIAAKHIPLITVGAGDRIRFGDGTTEIDVLSPDVVFARSPEPSDTSIVQRVITKKFTTLLAADIGVNVENMLLAQKINLHASILKAPFPGIGGATGDAFLCAIAPQTIVIAPGIKNTASAPTKSMLAYLASSTMSSTSFSVSSTKPTIVFSKPGVFLLYNE